MLKNKRNPYGRVDLQSYLLGNWEAATDENDHRHFSAFFVFMRSLRSALCHELRCASYSVIVRVTCLIGNERNDGIPLDSGIRNSRISSFVFLNDRNFQIPAPMLRTGMQPLDFSFHRLRNVAKNQKHVLFRSCRGILWQQVKGTRTP